MLLSAKRVLINFGHVTSSNSKIVVGQGLCNNRFFHQSDSCRIPVLATEGSVSKEALMQLRKRTGYSISKCKQAILQFGDDLAQAEEWLQTTARKEGWDKIAKRGNVNAMQGLLGMITANGFAAVVEVNCQTDFVARNDRFRSLVSQISRGVFSDAATNYRLENEDISSKWNLSFDRLSEKGLDFGSSLPDLLADNAGHLGEKIGIGGAFIMRVALDVSLSGYVHPRSEQNVVDGVLTGQFAALVALRAGKDSSEISRSHLGMQLCQHIIGMNPTGVGLPPDPEASTKEKEEESMADTKTASQPDETKTEEEIQREEEEAEAAQRDKEVTKLSSETTLLRQDFLLQPDVTVYDVLRQNDVDVVDFARLERGNLGVVHDNA